MLVLSRWKCHPISIKLPQQQNLSLKRISYSIIDLHTSLRQLILTLSPPTYPLDTWLVVELTKFFETLSMGSLQDERMRFWSWNLKQFSCHAMLAKNAKWTSWIQQQCSYNFKQRCFFPTLNGSNVAEWMWESFSNFTSQPAEDPSGPAGVSAATAAWA